MWTRHGSFSKRYPRRISRRQMGTGTLHPALPTTKKAINRVGEATWRLDTPESRLGHLHLCQDSSGAAHGGIPTLQPVRYPQSRAFKALDRQQTNQTKNVRLRMDMLTPPSLITPRKPTLPSLGTQLLRSELQGAHGGRVRPFRCRVSPPLLFLTMSLQCS